jgi:hypothetical protein
LKNSRPNSTENYSGIIEMRNWEDSVIKAVQGWDNYSEDEKAQIIQKANLGLTDYDAILESYKKQPTRSQKSTKSSGGGGGHKN